MSAINQIISFFLPMKGLTEKWPKIEEGAE
jgi:hypothetical protein